MYASALASTRFRTGLSAIYNSATCYRQSTNLENEVAASKRPLDWALHPNHLQIMVFLLCTMAVIV